MGFIRSELRSRRRSAISAKTLSDAILEFAVIPNSTPAVGANLEKRSTRENLVRQGMQAARHGDLLATNPFGVSYVRPFLIKPEVSRVKGASLTRSCLSKSSAGGRR